MPIWKDNLDKKLDNKEAIQESSPLSGMIDKADEDVEPVFSDADIEKKIKQAEIDTQSPAFVMMIVGADGSGKSGIVLDYLSKKQGKSMIIDLDGGNAPLIYSYYKGNKNLIVINPLETKTTATNVDIDYRKTMAEIKAIVKYIRANYTQYDAIVIDGLSTLLKYAEYQLRIDKNIAPDGGMQLRYWLNRAKVFTEILEIAKSVPKIDKFLIGHEDLILKETGDNAAVKMKLNQMVHQRIICRKRQNLDKIEFVAKIDKSKYNLGLEGKEYIFATVEGKNVEWKANGIFEGLK